MFLHFVKLGVKLVCPLSLSLDCFRAGSSRVARQARLSTRKGPSVFTSLNAGDGVDGERGLSTDGGRGTSSLLYHRYESHSRGQEASKVRATP